MTSPIYTGGDADPGGQDVVAGSSLSAVTAANARLTELRADTYGQGSQIGDSLTLPETNEHSKHQGGDDEGYRS